MHAGISLGIPDWCAGGSSVERLPDLLTVRLPFNCVPPLANRLKPVVVCSGIIARRCRRRSRTLSGKYSARGRGSTRCVRRQG
jgi:hypothetical protein